MNRRQLHGRQGDHARATNLVVPLPHEGTAMRITETVSRRADRSSAVSAPVSSIIGRGNVDRTNDRRTRRTQPTPGTRASTTATRTTTGRTTTTARAPSADWNGNLHADFSFEDLVAAYKDARRTKRNSHSALAFEADLERNLCALDAELRDGSYRPGPSICFAITRPKRREVWAAAFRDRIVHHLLYNQIAVRFHRAFIADSCACIPGRGTLYAVNRLEHKIRSITQNWSKPAFYLKCDLANFFVAIDKRIVFEELARRVHEAWWLALAGLVLFHDPREGAVIQSTAKALALIPPHKSLFGKPAHLGLPIGNLSSQFFANVYLDVLDQHVKQVIRARHYIRYVDDFILLHESAQWLNDAKAQIEAVLSSRLHARLNPAKTILQPIVRGVDFVGQVIKPWHRTTRRRTYNDALARTAAVDEADFFETANSYFGLLRQATESHHDRARLAKVVLRRGHTVNREFTQTYRRAA